jgi:formylglycine-generating enzyme required for sulfatase activity
LTPASESNGKDQVKMVVVPDVFANEDRIGYQVHIEALVEMIRTVESKGSFTIGVYGQWGQGKTSMLRQIKNTLDDEQQNRPDKILTVWFNPWQFSSDEHLIIPFFHTFIASLEKLEKKLKKKDITKDFCKKLNSFLQKLVSVPIALAYGLEGKIKVPLLIETKFSVQKAIDEQRRAETEIDQETAKEEGADYRKFIENYESLYYSLLQDLQIAAEEFDSKIVIFIDDLDRCLPEMAVQLLEGLKVLLDVQNFVFVMGIAREVIERGIRVRYKELYLTIPDDMPFLEQNYLDKIIQFPISIPPADPEILKNHILEDQMNEIEQGKPFINTILKALGDNPRTVKRFINVISFSMWVAKRKQYPGNPFLSELLIKMSLIAFLFPDLYRQVRQSPHDLIRLQEISWKLDEEAEKRTDEDAGKTSKVTKTNLARIDQWLEEAHLSKLRAILKREKREQADGGDLSAILDKGFKDADEVKRYIYMLAPTLSAETDSKKTSHKAKVVSLKRDMEDRMIRIEGGSFLMGEEKNKRKDTVKSLEMDMYAVTQSIYTAITGDNPSSYRGDDRPVENVSWFDAIRFCNQLSERTGLSLAYKINGQGVEWLEESNGFRLPNEAEWEYACRAGIAGEQYGEIDAIAWYDQNSGGQTHSVGEKKPNAWGLYDMLGNVWEWCWDRYDEDRGYNRVIRGGSWIVSARRCRSAHRVSVPPDDRGVEVGFRLARSVTLNQSESSGR